MTCPNCGAPVEAHHRFCPDCGRALPEREPGAQPHASGAFAMQVRVLGRRSKALIIALWGSIAISASNAVLFGAQPTVPATTTEPAAGDTAAAITGLIVLLISIAAPVFWLFWQRHAQANLFAFGIRDLRFSPGWVIAWWLIPFANLVMPFKTVGELVRHSTGAHETPPWLAAWWGCFVGATLLIAFGSSVVADGTSSSSDQGYYAMAVGAVAHVIAGLLAMRIVRRVQAGQEALAGSPA
jgi:hypothetical protein